MEEFSIIYRILRELRSMMDCEEADPDRLCPVRLRTSVQKRDALLLKLADAGYIDGVQAVDYVGNVFPVVEMPPVPSITIKGLEYLAESPLMQRAAQSAKGIRCC